ncbi:hypothetical protein RE428_13440 [Marinobacter nanhaiticus D15-8W]|nr:hypothetical protein RE428_13440 [Marinobacter nanhaiticus D15-8W]
MTTYLEVDDAYMLTKVRAEIRGPQKVSQDTTSAAHQTLTYLLKSYTSASPDLLAGLIDRCEEAVDLPAVSKDGGSYHSHFKCRKPHFSDDAFLDLDITYSAIAS